jgi:CHAT domain-containing protein
MSLSHVITARELVEQCEQDALPPVQQLIHHYHLTRAAIQQLKEYSAEFYLTDPPRALTIAQLAYTLSQGLPAPAPALGAWTLGNALMFADRFAEANHFFQAARTSYLQQGAPLDAARMSVAQVFTLAYSGRSEEALALAAESEPLLTAASQTNTEDRRRLNNLLLNRGVAHELCEEYEEALAVYERQMALTRTLDDPLMLAQLKHNQAYALAQIGALTDAATHYQDAEQLLKQQDAPTDLIRLYTNYAAVLALLGNYRAARERQDQAEALLQTQEGVEQQRQWLNILRARLDLQAGWPVTDATLARMAAARDCFAANGPPFAAGLATLMLGYCYLARQQGQQAADLFRQAEQIAEQSADRNLGYRAHHGLGQVAVQQGALTTAIAAYTNAIQQIESMRAAFHIELFRADFLTDKLTVYQDLVRLYCQSEQSAAAFQVVERAKARLLTEKLAFRLIQEAAGLPPTDDAAVAPLMVQLRTALQALEQLSRQARVEGLQSQSEFGKTPTTTTAAAIRTQEQQIHHLMHAIEQRQTRFSVYATGEPAPLTQIQRHLTGKVLLQYHLNHDEIWLFVVDDQGVVARTPLAARQPVEQARQQLTAVMERTLELSVRFGALRAQRYLPALLAEANQQLEQLYQLLFAPCLPLLQGRNSLIIAPDQALHYIPFHALYDGQAYLLENFTISYTPSATIFDLCRQERSYGADVLIMGYQPDTLAAITRELTQVHQWLPHARLLQGVEGTAAAFLQHAPVAGLIHLAAHAQFRLDQPLLSSLSLADRPLALAEIARLQLRAELIVLNGCETGHGQLHGADLLSLAGGFLSAGVSSLLVTLWRVEDTIAATLMDHFYQALGAGQSKAAALRTAQLHLLRQPNGTEQGQALYRHPAYWAPFILIGNDDVLTQSFDR